MEELINALRPLEILTKTICSDQFSVLQAEKCFNCILSELKSQHTKIADDLHEAVERRYQQRRNKPLLSCLTFLADPQEYSRISGEADLLQMDQLEKEMTALCTRLFPELEPTTPTASQGQQEPEEEAAEVLLLEETQERPNESKANNEKFAAVLRAAAESAEARKKKNAGADVSVPAELYCATKSGVLSDRLRKLMKALKSVQASSVDSERAFSTAGRFVTKIRSKLGDRAIDNYCFAQKRLKKYFLIFPWYGNFMKVYI